MSTKTKVKKIKPDSKGRISLGVLSKNVSSFSVEVIDNGKIVLTPFVEIPKEELWLFNNKEALKSVLTGIEEAKAGKVKSLGSFAEYADEDI